MPVNFFLAIGKILILLELWRLGMPSSGKILIRLGLQLKY